MGISRNAAIITTLCLAQVVACQEPEPQSQEPTALRQSDAVSQCGGFVDRGTYDLDDDDGDLGYCAAERLLWDYDGSAGTLVVSNTRALLNCCGEREVSMALTDGVYVITETDAPESGGGRCDCLCVFDLELTVDGLPEGEIALRFERHVTDADGPVVLFDGVLDLGLGAGMEILSDEDAGPWCEVDDDLSPPTDVVDGVSQCGGFPESMPDDDEDGIDDDYCDAERLTWQYDASTGTLELIDSRALLNCCGDHTMTLELVDGVYVATEIDEPQGDGGRCDCLCVFDFALTATGISTGSVPLRLVRHVTDEGAPVTIYEGTLDVTLGSGEIVLSTDDASPWCETL